MWIRYNPTSDYYEYSNDNGGSWAQLPLDASSITSGDLADARLSSNVPLLNAANVFTANQHLNQAAGPILYFRDTAEGANLQRWRVRCVSQLLLFEVINDAETVLLATPILMNRGGDVQVERHLIVVGDTILTGGHLKFPATQIPSADPNTVDDYEKGTWTPVDASGAGLVFPSSWGTYRKIGPQVWINGQVVFPATADGSGCYIGGLPYTTPSNGALYIGFSSHDVRLWIPGTVTWFLPLNPTTNVHQLNSQMSGCNIVFAGSYYTSS